MQLRDYQKEAVASVLNELKTCKSTLLVLATGSGKTVCFSAIARDWPGRVLVLAHRTELVQQAAASLEKMCGEPVEIEQGRRKSHHARLVVASVQSISQQHRLDRIGHDGFSLVVADEAHLYLAKSYVKVINWFASSKLLGVTATPQRGDKQALGKLFETVAYTKDLQNCIEDGYLAPLKIGRVHVQGIDVSGLKKVRGDLHAGQLDKIVLENVGTVVSKTMELHPDKTAVLFFPGVASAELASQMFNARLPGSSIFIDGRTEEGERAEKMAAFKRGEHQYFCNVGIATLGWDCPHVDLVVIARPTCSWSLYCQMIGRGSRTLPGVIDGLDTAEERRGAILWSAKPGFVVLDYVGASGKHELATPLDFLGGDYNDEERKIAKRDLEELDAGDPIDALELLEGARKKLEARVRALAELKYLVKAEVSYINPFTALAMDQEKIEAMELKLGRAKMSPATRQTLVSFGVAETEVRKMGAGAGTQMLRTLFSRHRNGLCDYGTLQLLKQWGVKTSRIYQRQGHDAAVYIAECGFGKSKPVNREHLIALATGN